MPVRPRNRAYMLGPNTSSWPSQVGSLDPYIILLFSSLIIIVFTLIPPEVRSMDIPYMSPFNTSPLYLRRSVFLKRPFSQCTEDQQAIPLPVTSGPRISSINFPTRQATKRQRGEKKKKKPKKVERVSGSCTTFARRSLPPLASFEASTDMTRSAATASSNL